MDAMQKKGKNTYVLTIVLVIRLGDCASRFRIDGNFVAADGPGSLSASHFPRRSLTPSTDA